MQDDEGKYYGDACGRCCWQVYWPVFWLGLALTPCAVSELCAKLLAPSKSDLQMARILVIARHYEILFGLKPLSCLFYFPKDTKHSILSCIEFQGLFQQFLFEYSILLLSKMHPLLLVRVRSMKWRYLFGGFWSKDDHSHPSSIEREGGRTINHTANKSYHPKYCIWCSSSPAQYLDSIQHCEKQEQNTWKMFFAKFLYARKILASYKDCRSLLRTFGKIHIWLQNDFD